MFVSKSRYSIAVNWNLRFPHGDKPTYQAVAQESGERRRITWCQRLRTQLTMIRMRPMDGPSILDRGIEYAHGKLKSASGDLSKLPEPLQTVVLVTHAQGMIDNGGFRYLFETDQPGQPLYSVYSDAYRRIGALKAGDLLDLAVALFPFEDPQLSSDRRNSYMDSLDESDELFNIGDEVCGDETIWLLLETYIRDNSALFQDS